MYEIKASYSTGDSFRIEDTSTILSPCWENLDRAKESLQLLKEHHLAYQSVEHRYTSEKIDYTSIVTAYWFTGKLKKNLKLNEPVDDSWYWSCYVVDDTGQKIQIHVPYHGYFEHLQSLEIESNTDDWKATF